MFEVRFKPKTIYFFAIHRLHVLQNYLRKIKKKKKKSFVVCRLHWPSISEQRRINFVQMKHSAYGTQLAKLPSTICRRLFRCWRARTVSASFGRTAFNIFLNGFVVVNILIWLRVSAIVVLQSRTNDIQQMAEATSLVHLSPSNRGSSVFVSSVKEDNIRFGVREEGKDKSRDR